MLHSRDSRLGPTVLSSQIERDRTDAISTLNLVTSMKTRESLPYFVQQNVTGRLLLDIYHILPKNGSSDVNFLRR